MRASWIILGIAAAAAAPVRAVPPEEWLAQAPLPDLAVGFRHAEGDSMIVERIPPGETVERWTRMATTQRFAGAIAGGVTLDAWLANFLTGLGNGCPGYRASAPRRFALAGRPALQFRADCPRNPQTGLPETFMLRAIAGARDLHVAQVAFRHVPTAAEARWAERHLDSVVLCVRSGPSPACRAGPEAFDR